MANSRREPIPMYDVGAMSDEEVQGLFDSGSPGGSVDLLNEIRVEADRVDVFARNHPEINPELRTAWDEWFKNFKAFYDEHTGALSFFANLFGETLDQVKVYKAKVAEWRITLEKAAGIKLPGPSLATGAPEESTVPWKFLLYVGGGVATLVAIGYVVKAFKE